MLKEYFLNKILIFKATNIMNISNKRIEETNPNNKMNIYLSTYLKKTIYRSSLTSVLGRVLNNYPFYDIWVMGKLAIQRSN